MITAITKEIMWRLTLGVKLVPLHTVPILHIVGSAVHRSTLTSKGKYATCFPELTNAYK